jgi:hypothetical protein
MSEQIDLWRLVEAAGLQFQQHEQASRGWLWALPGMDWSGPYDTKEEALTHALRWLVEHAREEHATELAAGECNDADFRVYQAIKRRVAELLQLKSRAV